MKAQKSNKRVYAFYGTVIAIPCLFTVFIMLQLYATMMRFY
jgi:hypothetical protein